MSDKFQPISMRQLCAWVFDELAVRNSVFGIPVALSFRPGTADVLRTEIYGHPLDTPFGVAAGPHSQMAQNIIAAWLCGARFIELKTVQTQDELELSKPCINMQDAGYNVEWSQELNVEQSFDEYLRAWVLIYALHRRLGFRGESPNVVFNVSIGYDYAGIRQPNVQWFLDHMRRAGERRAEYVETVAARFPEVADMAIPACLADSVTLSTMHGCPPDEIGKISAYLMETLGWHTNVKLNPTLLGPDRVRQILNDRLGYTDIRVPDEAFAHDLQYEDAIPLLRDLQQRAERCGVVFGVKLANTLEVLNHRQVFDPGQKAMYLSGRPLHALTVTLAADLARRFEGKLPISFAGGADAFNVADLLRGGLRPVTACSDILRPGGYTRLLQYIETARRAIAAAGADGLSAFICRSAREPGGDERSCALANLEQYAGRVLDDPRLRRDTFDRQHTKTARALGLFDCIRAPCTDACPVSQKVPEYMRLVREGQPEKAVAVTRDDNPLAAVLGRACNHACENVCLRTHYDEPLAIRELKRYVMEQERAPCVPERAAPRDVRVAVIGGGPCGLSGASFLARAGVGVTVFEAQPEGGGMVSATIPGYRADLAALEQDLRAIRALGVEFRHGQTAGRDFTISGLRAEGFQYVVIAVGAQRGLPLGVPGEDADGVLDALEFLRAARRGAAPALGRRVGVVGGGDVAMDCARTAKRLTGGEVMIVYRRTIEQMPAEREEREGAREEGIAFLELLAPRRLLIRDGKVAGLCCARMELGEPDASGRPRPVEIRGSETDLALDTLLVAVGQRADLAFCEAEGIRLNSRGYIAVDPETLETTVPGVYAGGDAAADGPRTIVAAAGDGRKIAADILRRESIATTERRKPTTVLPSLADLLARRAKRLWRVPIPHRPPPARAGFDEVIETLGAETAREEAARCLDCDVLCSTCAGVCPNRAIFTYECEPFEAELPDEDGSPQVRPPVKNTEYLRDHALESEAVPSRGGVTPGSPVGLRRRFAVAQRFQVAVLTDFCNECGNCQTFCPTRGAPYRDKPRLYLTRAEFEAQSGNAFMILRDGNAWSILARCGGDTHSLLTRDGDLLYRSPWGQTVLRADTLAPVSGASPVSLLPVAQMFVLLRALRRFVPHLPTASV